MENGSEFAGCKLKYSFLFCFVLIYVKRKYSRSRLIGADLTWSMVRRGLVLGQFAA
jgi:hypothetical protein